MAKRSWTREEALAHPLASRVIRILSLAPGLTAAQLLDATGAGWESLTLTLGRLERSGLLHADGSKRRVRFYAGVPFPHAQSLDAREMLPQRTSRIIARKLLSKQWPSVRDLSDALGLSERVVYYHMQRFDAHGLILKRKPTRYHDFTGTEELRRLLRALATAPPKVRADDGS